MKCHRYSVKLCCIAAMVLMFGQSVHGATVRGVQKTMESATKQQPTQVPAPQQTPGDRKVVPFSAVPGTYFQAGVGVTSVGEITVDVTIQTAPGAKSPPIALYLRNESTGQMSASSTIKTPVGRLVYQIKQTDLPAGAAVYTVLIGSSVAASGNAVITFPKNDAARLNDYLNRLPAPQKAAMTSALAAPAQPTQQPSAAVASAASRAAAVSTLAPRKFILPSLERSPLTHFIAQQPVDITPVIQKSPARQAIPFRPFTLEEVFDLRTGKPLYAMNIDETNGQLKLPHRQGAVISRARPLVTQELQQRGIVNSESKRQSTVRFGKLDNSPMTIKSRIAYPKHDGSVLESSAEEYLRELNSFEQQLNAIGQTLRDPITGKIKTTPAQTTLAGVRQNNQLFTNQLQNSDRLLKKNLNVQPWGRDYLMGLHSKASGIGVQKKGRTMSRLAPSEQILQKRVAIAAQNKQAVQPSQSPQPPASSPGALNNRFAGGAASGLGPATSGIADKYISNDKCILGSVPDGGGEGEQVVLQGERLDNTCTVAFEDAAGKKVPAQILKTTATEVTVKVPAGLSTGIGSVTLTSSSSISPINLVSTHHTRPFPIGRECTISSVYPPQGAADTKLTLSVLRFNSCKVALEDATTARNNLAVTNIDPTTVTVTTPNLTLGSAKIIAIRSADASQTRPAPVSQVPFKILRTVIDGDGNSPPPDFFAMGIKPFERKYPWEQVYGDPATFAFSASAAFSISSKGPADDNLVRFNGDAATTATLYNFPVEIIGAHATASIPSATSNDSKLKADFKVTAAGITVYKLEKKKDKEDAKEEATCDDSAKDKNGKCCENKDGNNVCIPDDSAVSINVQYKLEKEFKLLSIDKAVDTHFTLGPVPMVARIGFRGSAGANVRVALSPIQIIGTAAPYVRTSVYGECAADLVFATAGIGANMTLANLDINAGGRATLDFGQLAIQTDLYVQYKYDLLSGYLYAFVTAFGQRYEQKFYDWAGFKGDGYLLAPYTYTVPLFPG